MRTDISRASSAAAILFSPTMAIVVMLVAIPVAVCAILLANLVLQVGS